MVRHAPSPFHRHEHAFSVTERWKISDFSSLKMRLPQFKGMGRNLFYCSNVVRCDFEVLFQPNLKWRIWQSQSFIWLSVVEWKYVTNNCLKKKNCIGCFFFLFVCGKCLTLNYFIFFRLLSRHIRVPQFCVMLLCTALRTLRRLS